jgi:hypothetical protein
MLDDYAARVSEGVDGSLLLDSFPFRRMLVTAESGHYLP